MFLLLVTNFSLLHLLTPRLRLKPALSLNPTQRHWFGCLSLDTGPWQKSTHFSLKKYKI
jgi:hypothetical protein